MIDYNFPLDTWLLTYDPETAPEVVDDGIAPQGNFSALAKVTQVPNDAAAGLYWRSAGVTYYWLARLTPAEEEWPFLNVTFIAPIRLRIEYADGVMTLSSSTDQINWTYRTGISTRNPLIRWGSCSCRTLKFPYISRRR